ncbi:MAG: hypothetical protein IPG72_01970 [Ardenticatenales bacterium]|nr:hypothetical protein [Ardenticatenales bacterium]
MSVSADRVMIISNPDDEHTARVAWHLRAMDIDPIMLYPEHFGDSHALSLHLAGVPARWNCSIRMPSMDLDMATIASVWYRRPRLPLAGSGLSGASLAFARDEWRSAISSLYALSTFSLWVSSPERLHLAANKPRQLLLASNLGFAIPRTLISSDPRRIAEFYHDCDGRIIAKATGTGWLSGEDHEVDRYVLTNRVMLNDLMDSPALSLAPTTFQEEILKAYELRVTVVGSAVHAVRIDSQASAISAVDWRRYDTANTPYSPYELPPALIEGCLAITHALGLEYGAIDLICTPTGQYVFLEINGNGQFLWAEMLSGVPIARSVACLLARSAPSLTESRGGPP